MATSVVVKGRGVSTYCIVIHVYMGNSVQSYPLTLTEHRGGGNTKERLLGTERAIFQGTEGGRLGWPQL